MKNKKQVELETLRLLKTLSRAYSPELRNRIVVMWLPLVHDIANSKRQVTTETYEDLFQVGCIGLIKAVGRYQLGSAASFGTFANRCVYGEISHHMRDNVSLVQIPRKVYESRPRIFHFQDQFQRANLREPSTAETAKALELKEEDVALAMNSYSSWQPRSMDFSVLDGEDVSDLHDMLGTRESDARLILEECLAKLEGKNKDVFSLAIQGHSRGDIEKMLKWTEREFDSCWQLCMRHAKKLMS
jgi:RNA polymerase sigma-B factor